MKLRRQLLASWWDTLRSSYWFVPGLMVLSAAVLATWLVRVEHEGLFDPSKLPVWIRLTEPDPARAVLTTIAGSTISIVTLTFSITIVALTLASSQYGPRLLYNFMRDRQNQVVLGVLLGTFVYCLLVLVSVRSGDVTLPQLALMGAIVLSLASIGVLIVFLHHTAEKMQASSVIADVSRELQAIVRRNQPNDGRGELCASTDGRGGPPEGGAAVHARSAGMLQAIDGASLVELACHEDVEVVLALRPGDYVYEGCVVARVHGAGQASQAVEDGVVDALVLGRRRTLVQDVEYAFDQLVEIAVRALSPGINDPFTAMSCIDELGVGLLLVAREGPTAARLVDGEGRTRVHLLPVDFELVARASFDQIRRQATGNPVVLLHLLETLERLVALVPAQEQREILRRHGELARAMAVTHVETDEDERAVRARYEALERTVADRAGARVS